MDKKKSFLNIFTAIFFKIAILVLTLVGRKLLIDYIGNEVNGLNSLYTSILTSLSIVELGAGTAIVFSMYKPIIDNDNQKVAAFYLLFKKIYYIIGSIIIVGGLVLMFALPFMAKDYTLNINIYIPYIILLATTAFNYFYSFKTSLINAHKKNYITTIISSIGMILVLVGQIIILVCTSNFYLFTLANVVGTVLQWLFTTIYVKKNYEHITKIKDAQLSIEDKINVKKKIGAMFLHKIGSVLVNTIDSIIISTFIGVAILGKYTNYTTIVMGVSSLINLVFSSLVTIIGHAFCEMSKEKMKDNFYFLHGVNFIIGIVMYLGFYSIVNQLITVIYGSELVMGDSVVIVITVNYFIQYMRQGVLAFRDATGRFYEDRFKPIFEGLLNLVLSLAFVFIFKDSEFAVVGVIIATIITNLLVCHIIEPHILFKYAFECKPKKYYIRNYIYIGLFILALFTYRAINKIDVNSTILQLIINGSISIGVSLIIIIIIFITNKELRKVTNIVKLKK